jgi:hypothetical protein
MLKEINFNMKNKDKYIIENDGHSYIFTKNGVRHREVGPAFFWHTNKDKNEYLNLEDKDLYKLKKIKLSMVDESLEYEMEVLRIMNGETNKVVYFLDGQEYSKDEFEKIKSIRDLKNQLGSELPIAQSHTKKIKI